MGSARRPRTRSVWPCNIERHFVVTANGRQPAGLDVACECVQRSRSGGGRQFYDRSGPPGLARIIGRSRIYRSETEIASMKRAIRRDLGRAGRGRIDRPARLDIAKAQLRTRVMADYDHICGAGRKRRL